MPEAEPTAGTGTAPAPRFALGPGPGPGGPLPFCERCGRLVGAATSLERGGLRSCQACGLFACARCWEIASDRCPGCTVASERRSPLATFRPASLTSRAAQAPASAEASRTPRPPRARAAIPARRGSRRWTAAGALTVSAAVLAILGVTTMQPVGQVESALGTPGASTLAGAAQGDRSAGQIAAVEPTVADGPATPAAGSPRAGSRNDAGGGGSPAPGTGVGTAGDPSGPGNPVPTSTPGRADPTGTLPPAAPTATATPPAGSTPPTFGPTAPPASTPPATQSPTPTPAPPTPPPTPSPTPSPTPFCLVVPDLVGLTVSEARAAWRDTGFTGAFSPAFGQNNKTVLTQSQAAGECLPPTASISVTY